MDFHGGSDDPNTDDGNWHSAYSTFTVDQDFGSLVYLTFEFVVVCGGDEQMGFTVDQISIY